MQGELFNSFVSLGDVADSYFSDLARPCANMVLCRSKNICVLLSSQLAGFETDLNKRPHDQPARFNEVSARVRLGNVMISGMGSSGGSQVSLEILPQAFE